MVIGEPNARVTVLVASQRNLRVTRLLQLRPQTSRAYGKPAGLRYVSGGKLGITRVRAPGGFGYRRPEGSKGDDAIRLASYLGGSTHVVDATRENSLRSLALVAA
jgi:hypothetical protein